MKTTILNTCAVALLLMIAASCGEQDVVPENERQNAATRQAANENQSLIFNSAKVLPEVITGTINGIPFTGEFQINRFVSQGLAIALGGKLFAVGTIKNIVGENLPPGVADLVNQEIRIPAVYLAGTTCEVLNLVLGPVAQNQLGLDLQLNEVSLDISAAAVSDDLLGTLLCTLVSLFDGLGLLASIVPLLNQVIDITGVVGG